MYGSGDRCSGTAGPGGRIWQSGSLECACRAPLNGSGGGPLNGAGGGPLNGAGGGPLNGAGGGPLNGAGGGPLNGAGGGPLNGAGGGPLKGAGGGPLNGAGGGPLNGSGGGPQNGAGGRLLYGAGGGPQNGAAGSRARCHLARCNASTLTPTTTADGSRCTTHSLPLWRGAMVAVDLCVDRSREPRTRCHLGRCNASTLAPPTTTANGSRCATHSLPLWRGAIGCRRSLRGSFAWVTHSQPPGAVQRSGRNRTPATTASVAAAQAYRRAFFNGSPSLALPLVPMGQQLGGSTPWWRCRWCPWASSRLGWALP